MQLIDYLKSDAVKRITIVSVLVFWCTCLVAVRIERTGSGYYRFLLGNLFLAFMPLLFSSGLRIADRLELNRLIKAGSLRCGYCFFPTRPTF